jgi:dihydrofolate synthase / folylpolyglutamate synthase
MADHAKSDSPEVQAQLDRLAALSPGRDILGLERIGALLAALGHPERKLPPVFHVAGTNGKGSTCAVLRAALEADGKRVHVYASPHLVRFNERIRISGTLISDTMLADYLARALDAAGDISPSFFEATTAAAFLAFAEQPADACVIEVGLGGRLDATNMIDQPAVCGIAALGIDHEAFLGSDPAGIGREKAGIARPGRPIVTMNYPARVNDAVSAMVASRGGILLREGRDWHFAPTAEGLRVAIDGRQVNAALPALAGAHQCANAALAIAMLMAQRVVTVSDAALMTAPELARWPARMQRLGKGPLRDLLGPVAELWLDGGHNANAGEALSRALPGEGPTNIVIGMLANKDAAGFLAPMKGRIAALRTVAVEGHEHHLPDDLAGQAGLALGVADAASADGIEDALAQIAAGPARHLPTLICGSLYLAGEALRLNEELPD